MPDSIRDGAGQGYQAKVDGNKRLYVNSVERGLQEDAALRGDAFNINTGNITITSTTGLLYIKNTEENQDLIIESIALGVGSGSTSNIGELTAVANPTGGTTISSATAVSMNVNRNLGSSNELSADVYKGADGETLTGGTNAALFYHGTSSRLFATFAFIIPPNRSFGLTYNPQLSSGSVKCYAAIICYLRDTAES